MDTKKERVFLPNPEKMGALARLSGKIAHDLNNILGAIEGYATLAGNSLKAEDPAKEDMREIRQAVAKAAGLTRQFLVFSGRSGLRKTSCDIAGLLAGLQQKAVNGGPEELKIKLELRPGLPAINADTAGLEQALLNLLANAREAGGAITVRAEAASLEPSEVRSPAPKGAGTKFMKISVADTGRGIPEEDLELLFEPFFTTKEKSKGAGQGLAAVYGIAKYHNGWVEVKSAPGQGSEFSIYLPATTAGQLDS